MAVGFSGSNGGISQLKREVSAVGDHADLVEGPIEMSYFVNNVCNLNCRHCYVGYEEPKNALSVEGWQEVFNEALDLGALTFGNVGKEALLSWRNKTIPLLKFLREKREGNPRIRYGLVTNATLFDDRKISELVNVSPTYMDISFDGTKEVHDYVRGSGAYDKTTSNLARILQASSEFSERLFISFTLMRPNNEIEQIRKMIGDLESLGVRNFLVSPYVTSINERGELGITKEEVAATYSILKEEANDWLGKDSQLLLKVDYDTQKPLMDLLSERRIIELDKLKVDEYVTIFNQFGKVFLNYIPFSRTLRRDVRISHDGYVSGCYDMFFKDYPKRARANVKQMHLRDILISSPL